MLRVNFLSCVFRDFLFGWAGCIEGFLVELGFLYNKFLIFEKCFSIFTLRKFKELNIFNFREK